MNGDRRFLMANPCSRRAVVFGLGLGASAVLSGAARARAGRFPSRAITLIVPWPAGGTADRQLRLLAELAAEVLQQPVRVDNRPGGAGTQGPSQMAHGSAADGYTVAQYPLGMLRVPLMTRVPWQPIDDFSFIMGLSDYTFGLLVRHDDPWGTLADYLAEARRRPGEVSYGSAGVGGSPHLVMEELAHAAGVQLLHVPFKGGAEMQQALLGGHVMSACDASGFGHFVQEGRERLLVTFRDKRSRRWPSVPAARELGFDVVSTAPFGLAGPKGMDPAVVKVLHDAFRAAVLHPRHQALMEELDLEPFYRDGEGYRRFLLEQQVRERVSLGRLKLLESQQSG
jgi:tripartite-type tricarboxylate transporter receptor subunit TctC